MTGTKRAVTAGLIYFLVVFTAGFALGVLRTLWLEPALGEARAELFEMPLMVAVVAYAALQVGRRLEVSTQAVPRLLMGAIALLLLLAAEWAVVIFIDGQSVSNYVASRDPVAGAAYLAALVFYLLAPYLLRRFGR